MAIAIIEGGEGGRGGAGVGWLEGVDGGGLDLEGRRGGGVVGWKHAGDEHAGDLRGDDVVGDAELDGRERVGGGEEGEQVVVDAPQVAAVLPGVVEAAARYLGELAGAVEAGRSERVGGGGEDAPVGARGGVAGWVERRARVEEAFVGAFPGIGLGGEGV